MNIKNIVFDFGGVLVDWNPRYLYRDLFEDTSQMEYFLTYVCNDDWNLQQDKGRSLSVATAYLLEKFPQHEAMIKLYYEKWEKMLKSDIAENVNLLGDLNKKYQLFGLTNWSAETFPIALRRFSFFEIFNGIVVSGAEKTVKPDKEIYQILLERYQLQASQSVFIDDKLINIDAAKEIGFQTIHLDKGLILEDKLKEMNLM